MRESNSFETVEIMVHPALADRDSAAYYKSLNPRFVEFFKSSHRKSEFDLCFDSTFGTYF